MKILIVTMKPPSDRSSGGFSLRVLQALYLKDSLNEIGVSHLTTLVCGLGLSLKSPLAL